MGLASLQDEDKSLGGVVPGLNRRLWKLQSWSGLWSGLWLASRTRGSKPRDVCCPDMQDNHKTREHGE